MTPATKKPILISAVLSLAVLYLFFVLWMRKETARARREESEILQQMERIDSTLKAMIADQMDRANKRKTISPDGAQ